MQKIIKLSIFFTLVFLPCFAYASTTLFFSPESQEVGPNDTFGVDVVLDVSEGDCVNAIEGEIAIPNGLDVRDFMIGESIVSIWVEYPRATDMQKVNDEGILRFAGGIPGGYCGGIPGDPGQSNLVGKIILASPKMAEGGKSDFSLQFAASTKAYLNDGLGTPAELATKPARIFFSEQQREKWDSLGNAIKADNIQPEPFMVELYKSEQMFDGKYYVIFNTIDKQTGVDRYEILEIRSDEEVGGRTHRNLIDLLLGIRRGENVEWKRASTPHVLEDQSLQSIIRIRAVDKAGNERQVEYMPPEKVQEEIKIASRRKIIVISLWIGGGIILLAGAFVLWRFFSRKSN